MSNHFFLVIFPKNVLPKYGGEGGPATMGEYKGWRDQELEGGGGGGGESGYELR